MPTTYNVGSRSIFVTVTAWVFIVLAALASASALVQNAVVATLAPEVGMASAGQPLLTGLLLDHLPWVVGAGLAVSLATLGSAVGLLLRLEWARRVFIVLLAFAIGANVLGLWVQHEVVQALVSNTLQTTALPPQAAGVFGGFVTAARAMAVLVTLGTCGMLVWIIRRLMSPALRQEFA